MIRVGATVFVGKTILTPYRVVGVAEEGVPVIFNPKSKSNSISLCEEDIYCHVNFTDSSDTSDEDLVEVQTIRVTPEKDNPTALRPKIGEFVRFSAPYEGAYLEVRGFIVGKYLSFRSGQRGCQGYNYTAYSVSEIGCLRTRVWQVPQCYMKELIPIDYLPLEIK